MSPNGEYVAVVNASGDFVVNKLVHGVPEEVWQTRTNLTHPPGNCVEMESDGDLVVLSSAASGSKTVWSAGKVLPAPQAPTVVVLESSGELQELEGYLDAKGRDNGDPFSEATVLWSS